MNSYFTIPAQLSSSDSSRDADQSKIESLVWDVIGSDPSLWPKITTPASRITAYAPLVRLFRDGSRSAWHDALNSDLLKLSESFPAMQTIADNRKWVTVVKSSRDLKDLKTAAPAWIADYGASNVAIYQTPNGFYALAVRGDGTFTQAYRLTVSFIRSGRARDAYFAEASGWGPSLI